MIYLADVIEHMEFKEGCLMLEHVCQFLKPDGFLFVSCPDFDHQYNRMYKHALQRNTLEGFRYCSHVVFGHDKKYDEHKALWCVPAMTLLLEQIGMTDIVHSNRGGWSMHFKARKPENMVSNLVWEEKDVPPLPLG
jgi:predicted SAM-dependent methyltransferase